MTTAAPLRPAGLLRQAELPVSGLYGRHRDHNLASIAAAIVRSFDGEGPVRLGAARRLVVIAVDGLGYDRAASLLHPATLWPLTSEFPTTTIACLLTSVTGQPAYSHGVIGVQFLHEDGVRTVNCHDGQLTEPARPEGHAGFGLARPTATPRLPTVFDALALRGVATTVLPNELAFVHAGVRDRLLHGAARVGEPLAPLADPVSLVQACGDQLSAAIDATPGGLVWAYLDLDTHHHRCGFDAALRAAAAELDRLAARLCDEGSSVLIFSDHGLTPSQPSQDTLAFWQELTSERWCRLPPGGAGRTRWVYPYPAQEDKVAARLAGYLGDAVVASRDDLAAWGLAGAGSIGQRRLGEIVLLATGPDFPAADAATNYEHGSMTADEVLVPMATWPAG